MRGIKQEHEIIKALGITKDQLDELRLNRNFPFVQVTKSVRVYFEKSVERWLKENEKSPGSAIQLQLPKRADQ